MAKNFIQPGDVMTVPAPTGGVTAGSGVQIGVMFGVALNTAAQTVPFDLATQGVFTLPKVSAQAWTVGQAIYWDPDAGGGAVATTATSAGNLLIGVAAEVAANPSATGKVRLNGSFPAAVTA